MNRSSGGCWREEAERVGAGMHTNSLYPALSPAVN